MGLRWWRSVQKPIRRHGLRHAPESRPLPDLAAAPGRSDALRRDGSRVPTPAVQPPAQVRATETGHAVDGTQGLRDPKGTTHVNIRWAGEPRAPDGRLQQRLEGLLRPDRDRVEDPEEAPDVEVEQTKPETFGPLMGVDGATVVPSTRIDDWGESRSWRWMPPPPSRLGLCAGLGWDDDPRRDLAPRGRGRRSSSYRSRATSAGHASTSRFRSSSSTTPPDAT